MVGDPSRSHYEVLGVSRNATLEEIRAAHRHLAQMLHPDHHAADAEAERNFAERRMREVNEAWTVLSHSEHRAEYDRLLHQVDVRNAPPAPPSQTTRQQPVGFDSPDMSNGYHGTYIDDGGHKVDAMFFDMEDEESESRRSVPAFLWPVPVVAILGVALAIFLFTAYAGPDDKNTGTTPGAKPSAAKDCVLQQADGVTVLAVPCSGQNDGKIVATVDSADKCPVGSSPTQVDAKTVCFTPTVAVESATTGD